MADFVKKFLHAHRVYGDNGDNGDNVYEYRDVVIEYRDNHILVTFDNFQVINEIVRSGNKSYKMFYITCDNIKSRIDEIIDFYEAHENSPQLGLFDDISFKDFMDVMIRFNHFNELFDESTPYVISEDGIEIDGRGFDSIDETIDELNKVYPNHRRNFGKLTKAAK